MSVTTHQHQSTTTALRHGSLWSVSVSTRDNLTSGDALIVSFSLRFWSALVSPLQPHVVFLPITLPLLSMTRSPSEEHHGSQTAAQHSSSYYIRHVMLVICDTRDADSGCIQQEEDLAETALESVVDLTDTM